MKPVAFDYVAPGSLEEAVAALAEAGEDAKLLAGGQSLVPALNMRLVRPSVLVDLRGAGLGSIDAGAAHVAVGAMVRQAALQRSSDAHPLALRALPYVGHVATRNRGTVGGSVAHADGAAELPLCLVACGGTIVTSAREIPADTFFRTHFTTVLEPGEVLTATHWPRAAAGERWAFAEHALRAGDFALSMCAVRRGPGGTTVAVGAVTDVPTVLAEPGALAGTEPMTPELAREAGAAAARSVDPHGSIHASPAYLRHLTGVLVERALLEAA